MKEQRVGTLAKGLLVVALGIAAVGYVLERRGGGLSQVGRLLQAFGEAALVGGLADWFAVTALFQRPLGFPFHTAIIPRKRHELSVSAGEWVQNDLLPSGRLKSQIAGVDFVGRFLGLLGGDAARVELRAMLRSVLGDALADVEPRRASEWIAGQVSDHLGKQDLRAWMTNLAETARRKDWLWPLARGWFQRLGEWAESEEAKDRIRDTVKKTWGYYRKEGTWLERAVKSFAEVTPLVDLDKGAASLRELLIEFARTQQTEEGDLYRIVRSGVDSFGDRLRDDDVLYAKVQHMVMTVVDRESLASLLEPVLTTVRDDVIGDLASPNSHIADHLAARIETWVSRVNGDTSRRLEVNAWISRVVGNFIDRHHSAIGLMVRDQMDRLGDSQLVKMIKDKTGNDLNWIRINGSIVGGGIGVILFFIREALG